MLSFGLSPINPQQLKAFNKDLKLTANVGWQLNAVDQIAETFVPPYIAGCPRDWASNILALNY